MNIEADEQEMDQYRPTDLLQILVENAIKHNEFSDAPVIEIKLVNEELVIHNPVRKKILRKPSSKIGLQNLRERYRLITNKEIRIKEEEKFFTVILPVLKII
jgi:LytS/YehU family sensor histidine kinase